jgi:hypothetical protein
LAAAAAGAAAAAAGLAAAFALGALGVFAAGAERALGAARGAVFFFSAPTAGMPPFGRPVLFLAFGAAFFGAALVFLGAA